MRRAPVSLILVVTLLAALGGWVATSASVAATPAQLAGMRAAVTLPAGRTAVWHSVLTPQGICNYVLAGCRGVMITDRNHYRLGLHVVLPPTAANPWLDVTVTRRTASRALDLHLTSNTSTGSIDARLALRLSGGAAGVPTTLTTRVSSARGRGVTGRAAIQALTQYPAALGAAAQSLTADYRDAGAALTIRWVRKGGKLKISPQVRYAVPMLPAPRPTGKVRIYRNGHRVCTRTLKAGTATCAIKRPRKGTRITLVATGDLGTGYPMWHTATRRYQR